MDDLIAHAVIRDQWEWVLENNTESTERVLRVACDIVSTEPDAQRRAMIRQHAMSMRNVPLDCLPFLRHIKRCTTSVDQSLLRARNALGRRDSHACFVCSEKGAERFACGHVFHVGCFPRVRPECPECRYRLKKTLDAT